MSPPDPKRTLVAQSRPEEKVRNARGSQALVCDPLADIGLLIGRSVLSRSPGLLKTQANCGRCPALRTVRRATAGTEYRHQRFIRFAAH